MSLFSSIKQYADQIGGQFTDYDHSKAVIVVPVSGSRFQTVLVLAEKSVKSGRDLITCTSRVCEYNAGIDAKKLIEQASKFDYSRFVIEDNFLKVEAAASTSVSDDQVMEMIQEVATLADQYEHSLTGKDIH